MKLSVCIPTYEQGGKSGEYLRHSLDILKLQTFKDFEIVVSDDSVDNVVENLCKEYGVKYSKNAIPLGISANTNKAMSMAKGKLIKILFMDDFLYNEDSLQYIADNFKGDWMVTACEHSRDGKTFERKFFPRYNQSIHTGYNTISSPSVLTVKRDGCLYFDETLSWLMDCDYYKRCHKKFGHPTILNTVTVVNRISDNQATNMLSNERKEYEVNLMKEKYDNR